MSRVQTQALEQTVETRNYLKSFWFDAIDQVSIRRKLLQGKYDLSVAKKYSKVILKQNYDGSQFQS